MTIGVYVDGDPEKGRQAVSRDWPTWARLGIIDKINLMLYSDQYGEIYDPIVNARRITKPYGQEISSTIDCYCGFLYTPQLLREGAWVSLLAGADEVVICRDGAIERLGLFAGMKLISQDVQNEALNQNVVIRTGELNVTRATLQQRGNDDEN